MKSDLKEYNDDQLECIDNRMYIKSSKKLLTGIHVEYHKNGNVKWVLKMETFMGLLKTFVKMES